MGIVSNPPRRPFAHDNECATAVRANSGAELPQWSSVVSNGKE